MKTKVVFLDGLLLRGPKFIMHWLAVYVTTNATPFPQDYYFSWPAVVQALASAAIAVFVGGLIPAIQASRIRIADALAFD